MRHEYVIQDRNPICATPVLLSLHITNPADNVAKDEPTRTDKINLANRHFAETSAYDRLKETGGKVG